MAPVLGLAGTIFRVAICVSSSWPMIAQGGSLQGQADVSSRPVFCSATLESLITRKKNESFKIESIRKEFVKTGSGNVEPALAETETQPVAVLNDVGQILNHLDAIDQTVKQIGLDNFGDAFDLNDSWCQGASAILDALLSVKFHNLKMMPVRTQPLDFIGKKHHTYERSETPLPNGEYLIVDGTIRQFFWPKIDPREDQDIPQLFVGTESDLRKLFLTYLNLPGVNPEQLVTEYLQTQSVRQLAETDPHIASTLQPQLRDWITTHAAQLEPRL